jgi:hypothetical protein
MLPEYRVEMEVQNVDGSVEHVPFLVGKLAMARFTARDRATMRSWLDAEREKGMTGYPLENPSICFAGRYLLTSAEEIEVQGPETAGEVEFVVFRDGSRLYITVGSDHCDRSSMSLKYEDKPKQMAPRVIAKQFWRYEDVRDHWDQLHLRSWVTKNGVRMLYQDSPVATQCTVEQLFEHDRRVADSGTVLFGGTVDELMHPVYEDEFEMELSDPILNRSLRHRYAVTALPDDSPWRGY